MISIGSASFKITSAFRGGPIRWLVLGGMLLIAAIAIGATVMASNFRERALRNSDDKYFVEASGVYLDLMWLNAEVGTGGGDVAGGADFAPTEAQLQ